MKTTTANKIYDILMFTCGAKECWREDFVQTQTTELCKEYRFQGDLAFGGKFWRCHSEPWKVNYYAEDATPMRDTQVKLANFLLKRLYDQATAGDR